MLLEKSDSATSLLGFTTTWSERREQLNTGDVASECVDSDYSTPLPFLQSYKARLYSSLILSVNQE